MKGILDSFGKHDQKIFYTSAIPPTRHVNRSLFMLQMELPKPLCASYVSSSHQIVLKTGRWNFLTLAQVLGELYKHDILMAPPAGLEPATSKLTAWRATDCAIEEYRWYPMRDLNPQHLDS